MPLGSIISSIRSPILLDHFSQTCLNAFFELHMVLFECIELPMKMMLPLSKMRIHLKRNTKLMSARCPHPLQALTATGVLARSYDRKHKGLMKALGQWLDENAKAFEVPLPQRQAWVYETKVPKGLPQQLNSFDCGIFAGKVLERRSAGM